MTVFLIVGLVLIGCGVLQVWGLCRAAALGDRQLEQDRRDRG